MRAAGEAAPRLETHPPALRNPPTHRRPKASFVELQQQQLLRIPIDEQLSLVAEHLGQDRTQHDAAARDTARHSTAQHWGHGRIQSMGQGPTGRTLSQPCPGPSELGPFPEFQDDNARRDIAAHVAHLDRHWLQRPGRFHLDQQVGDAAADTGDLGERIGGRGGQAVLKGWK